MAQMGDGYGSECHLLRYLGRHRRLLDAKVREATGALSASWLDFGFDKDAKWQDREHEGLSFLPESSKAVQTWRDAWPQSGTQHNWDAVGEIETASGHEWLLVEAKANIQEIRSSCGAGKTSRGKIEKVLSVTKTALGVPADADWLKGYYQFANRLAVVLHLRTHGVPARLLMIYFCGDKGSARRECPKNAKGWDQALHDQYAALKLDRGSPLLKTVVHTTFLDVCPKTIALPQEANE